MGRRRVFLSRRFGWWGFEFGRWGKKSARGEAGALKGMIPTGEGGSMGVGAGLAALAVFATAGGGGFFARGAGAAILCGAADICEDEGEKAEAEEDGFHGCQ